MRDWTVLALLSCLAASCGDDRAAPEADAAPHPEHHVLLWVDPVSELPVDDMLAGCDAWSGSGVGCDLVDGADASDVQIYADPSPCEPMPDGSVVLAYATCCGPVVFFRECFRRTGKWDHEALATVSTHEIGHQFGLWWHVSESCHGNVPKHPSGEKVCGEAVMNAYYERETATPTEIDGLAFDIRDEDHSVVGAYNHHAGEHDDTMGYSCVYTTRP